MRVELGQDAHTPIALAHDGFDHGCDLLEHLKSITRSRLLGEVLKLVDQGVKFGGAC